MSLLNIIREEAITINVRDGGEAYKYVTEQMLHDAKSGAHEGHYALTDFVVAEREPTVMALKLQGFNCCFQNESHRDIWVSWLPKHPR